MNKRALQARKEGGEAMRLILSEAIRDLKGGPAAAKEKAAKMLCHVASLPPTDDKDGASLLVEGGAIAPLIGALSGGLDGLNMHAAAALATIASASEAYQKAVGQAGAIAPLCVLLRSGSATTMLQAAAALSALSEQPEYQSAIVKGGAIAPLVRLLRVGQVADAQAAASIAIANVCATSAAAQEASAAAGAIPLLIGMLREGGSSQTAAARALASLSGGSERIRREITSSGGVASLLPLLSSLSVPAQVQAAGALAELTRGNPEVQGAIAKAGGIGPLLAMLQSRVSEPSRANGAAALAQLASQHADNQRAIACAGSCAPGELEGDPSKPGGGLSLLIGLLDASQPVRVQASAAFAIAEVCRASEPNQTAAAELGGARACIELLAPTDERTLAAAAGVDVRAEAAGALWVLADVHEANKQAISRFQGIPALVLLLSSGSARAQEHSAHALAAIALGNTENQLAVASPLVASLVSGGRPGPLMAPDGPSDYL